MRLKPKLLPSCIGFALEYEQFVHQEEQHEEDASIAAYEERTRLHIAPGDEALFDSTIRLPAVQS